MVFFRHWKALIVTVLNHFKFEYNYASFLQVFVRYIKEANRFMEMGGVINSLAPRLEDYNTSSGSMTGAYFHHDLLIAQKIYLNAPARHVDVGSRIDGFVAHVASFREITIFDIRHFEQSDHPNIKFQQVDFMDEFKIPQEVSDSVSCLNTLEHFGLGRYSDPLDILGHVKGFNNLVKMLKKDGTLYVSVPVSLHPKIHFNAHRIFDPKEILTWAYPEHKLELNRFDFVDDAGHLYQNIAVTEVPSTEIMGHGIYTFRKIC
jgi:hypothetical protein